MTPCFKAKKLPHRRYCINGAVLSWHAGSTVIFRKLPPRLLGSRSSDSFLKRSSLKSFHRNDFFTLGFESLPSKKACAFLRRLSYTHRACAL